MDEITYVDVTATVTRHGETVDRMGMGSYPAWALPLAPDWKKSRRQVAYEAIGHYPQRNDGYRVTFVVGEPY